MALFRRRKAAEMTEQDDVREDDGLGATTDDSVEGLDAQASGATPPAPFERTDGPFDLAEADESDRLDLGSLLISPIEGMQLRLEVDQSRSAITAATAVIGDSSMQLTAFAAPRSGGLWDEIRDELAAAVATSGGTAEIVDGPLGRELRARRPAAGPGGRTVFAPSRFVGVDGPRWFLRGVVSGRAAIDDHAAAPLIDLFKRTVVVRGSDPMGPREMLPIVMPAALSGADGADGADASAEAGDEAAGADPLKPFERGPEITQVG